ncbi:hypothetical protein PsYK624_134250 [Phanerochaete sordida]|uniref:Uncharacterized protein n=1 Tax=Phanerochaete sordida TaxID=48140 RepID=A0A9P3LKG1_9APHY|nr:hypothetical protein PsYK624_134250 [Phanerochaete sordida]
MGDYSPTIRGTGTADSYSTQFAEQLHHKSKSSFPLTGGKEVPMRLAAIQTREAAVAELSRTTERNHQGKRKRRMALLRNDPEKPFTVAVNDTKSPISIQALMQEDDAAVKGFYGKLKDHLLPRLKALHTSGRPMNAQEQASPGKIQILHDKIYEHGQIFVNYTTYDVRRAHDLLRPRSKKSKLDVMVLADPTLSENEGPCPRFWYARVLGVYHAFVKYNGPGQHHSEREAVCFLWVRWYETINPESFGWENSELERLSFPPVQGENSFGFINPADVVRAAHIIPSFSDGKKHPDGGGSSLRAGDADEWRAYFVGRFSDRDLTMREHWGMGVGHVYSKDRPCAARLAEHQRSDEDMISDFASEEYDGYDGEISDDPNAEWGLEDRLAEFTDSEYEEDEDEEDDEEEEWDEGEDEDEDGERSSKRRREY